jgi:CheY-like chemotaxis protein
MPTAPNAPEIKLVVVIDDDPVIREAMGGLLQSWGYQVVVAASEEAALAELAKQGRRPDLIICDYRLAEGHVGDQAIAQLRDAFEIPAVLITGGVPPKGSQETNRYHLMHKPVDATALQTMLSEMFKRKSSGEG